MEITKYDHTTVVYSLNRVDFKSEILEYNAGEVEVTEDMIDKVIAHYQKTHDWYSDIRTCFNLVKDGEI